MRGFKEEVIKKLSKALVIYQNEIAPAFFKSLINSIEERYDAVGVRAILRTVPPRV